MEAKDEIKKIVDFVMDLDMLTGIETAERDHIETAVIEGYKAGIKLVVEWMKSKAKIIGSDIDSDMEGGFGEYLQYELRFDDMDIAELLEGKPSSKRG